MTKRLLRGLLPRAREEGVAEELRGCNWNQPPMSAIYDAPLALYEVAGGYCPTGRDVYLRRVERVKADPNLAMLQGRVLHQVMADLMVLAKKLIYTYGPDNFRDILEQLNSAEIFAVQKYKNTGNKKEFLDLKGKIDIVANFEKARITSRIQEALVKHPYIEADSLVANALPVVVEQKLDGSFLGLSPISVPMLLLFPNR